VSTVLYVILQAAKSMDAVMRKHDETLGSRMLLNPAERNAVNIVHGYLEPFYKTTNNICSNKFPTVGLVLFFMDHISEMIAACKESHHYPDWLKSAAEDMAMKATSYSSQVCNPFSYMSAILDPRIKGELIPESLNTPNNLEEARSLLLRNYSTAHFSSSTGIYGAPDNGGSVSFAEEIARKKRRASMSTSTDELSQYLSEPPAPIPTDVLEWWKTNSSRYPRLSVMARDFLSVQPTSVPPEELFCSKGDEIEKQRFGLPSASIQVLLCIKSWTESGIKLQYNSTDIDCDRFMQLAAEATGQSSKTDIDKKQR